MCAVVVCVDDVGNIVSGNVHGTMELDTISYTYIFINISNHVRCVVACENTS